MSEVCGYRLKTTDGEIGRVEDFLLDDHSWNIRYLIVDTGKWLSARKVLVSPWWIDEVNWERSEISADLTREMVRGSPEYEPGRPLTFDEVGKLHDYYGRPHAEEWHRPVTLTIESPAFANGTKIPLRYTQFGENRRPTLIVRGVPPEAISLAILVDDPDAAHGLFCHWIAFNLNPRIETIDEDSDLAEAAEGLNESGQIGYTGPRPPEGQHRYLFHLLALDCVLPLTRGADRGALWAAMQGHIIASALLLGLCSPPLDAVSSAQ